MRPYRGKPIDDPDGEFVYGWYALEPTKGAVILADVGDEHDGMPCLREIEVIPETVGQQTGLTDKNGKEIYAGDIVKANDAFVDVVEFNAAAFIFEGREAPTQGTVIRAWNELEIISNIHENKNLLEGERK